MSKFRNDIQKLRGICMIVIFVYHYNKNYIPCGVFGVDIFFIISGYVNSISFTKSNKYSYNSFFCRRILRLLPISFLGMLYSILVIHKTVIPQFQNKLLDDVLSCAISLSNYRFFSLSINYVLQSESKSIVLHYWSLSVEDQFYALFPLLFYFYHFKLISLFIIIISFSYSIYIYHYYYSLLYFSTATRIWEFLLGSVLITNNKQIKYKKLVVVSLLLCFFLKILVKYVPISSILPLCFISLILINNDDNIDVLSINYLSILGNISYPFYVFHYIIMYYYKNNGMNIIYQFLIDIIISNILFKLIVINSRKMFIKNIFIISTYISSIIIVIYITRILIKKNINIQNKNNYIKYTYIQINDEWYNFFRNSCKCNSFFSHKISKNIILLLMDSHGEQWSNIYIPYATKLHYILLQIYYKDYYICNKKYKNLVYFFSKYNSFSYIIISHHIHCIHNNTPTFMFYIKYLLNYTSEIYIIQDTPHFTINPINCIYSNKKYCYGIINVNATINRFPEIISKRIHFVDMNKFICKKKYKCNFIINNIPVYKDEGHLTLQFSKTLEKEFLMQFKLNKPNTLVYNEKCRYEYRCFIEEIIHIA